MIDVADEGKYTKLVSDCDVEHLPIAKREYHVEVEVYCDPLIGPGPFEGLLLYVRVRPSGHKSYYARFKGVGRSAVRTQKVGDYSDFTLEEAKIKAQRIWDRVEHEGLPAKRVRISPKTPLKHVFSFYLEQHFGTHSAWAKTVISLFKRHLLPLYGSQPVRALRRQELVQLIDKLSLKHPSRANNLTKALKAFLSWCVDRGLLEGNPLGRVGLLVPPKVKPSVLGLMDIAAIFERSADLGEPWRSMVRLMILTGEPGENVRHIRGQDIDWRNREWFAWRRTGQVAWYGPDEPSVYLNEEALSLLQICRNQRGLLFPSPRRRKSGILMAERPIYFRTGIVERLSKATEITGLRGIADIRRAVLAHGQLDAGSTQTTVDAWGRRLTRAIKEFYLPKSDPLDDVVL